MKEATGEANMTIVTIVLIAGVLTVGGLIISGVMNSVGRKSCQEAGGTWTNGVPSGTCS